MALFLGLFDHRVYSNPLILTLFMIYINVMPKMKGKLILIGKSYFHL